MTIPPSNRYHCASCGEEFYAYGYPLNMRCSGLGCFEVLEAVENPEYLDWKAAQDFSVPAG